MSTWPSPTSDLMPKRSSAFTAHTSTSTPKRARSAAVVTGAVLSLALLVAGCARDSDPVVVSDANIRVDRPSDTSGTQSLESLGLSFALLADGLDQPLFVASARDESGRLFVVQKAGLIRVIDAGVVRAEPFLDLTDAVSTESERGLLGLAFAPDYFNGSGLFYVDYTDLDGNTVVSEFKVAPDEPLRADPRSERIVLRVRQPYANHNGGMIAFGPDGYLYIGTGDGGSGGDPHGNGQNVSTLLGKLLRIDPRTDPVGDPAYLVPSDNPFVRPRTYGVRSAATEIWAYGLRNPWRFSFDRETGDLWIGDVGQDTWEEIDFQPASSTGGEDYGWNVIEGTHPYPPGSDPGDTSAMTLPLVEYDHSAGSSVTGGYVYRGTKYTALRGVYLYGDYGSGTIWGLRRSNGSVQNAELARTKMAIASFGEDADGELFVVDLGGSVYRIGLE